MKIKWNKVCPKLVHPLAILGKLNCHKWGWDCQFVKWCGFVNASMQGCGVIDAWVCKCEEYFGTNFMNSFLGCTFITLPLTKHHPSNDMVLTCH